MKKDRYKTVEVGGAKYRISKLPAMTACYIGTKLMLGMGGGSGDISAAVSSLTKPCFFEIQGECLRAVNKLTEANGSIMPEPLIRADGRFVDPDMEYDLPTVFQLTVEVLMFNVSGFFGGKGLAALKNSLSLPTK